jgi:hypothetical protein
MRIGETRVKSYMYQLIKAMDREYFVVVRTYACVLVTVGTRMCLVICVYMSIDMYF